MLSAGSLSDAPGASALVAAMAWLEGTLLGTIATSVAVIAVSWVGMLMLLGRLEIRRGLTVIAGGFILFGASAIAGGLRAFVGNDNPVPYAATVPPPPMPPAAAPPPARVDPYAGASVPGH